MNDLNPVFYAALIIRTKMAYSNTCIFNTRHRTMIETVKHINDAGLRKPLCIATHGVFAGNAYNELLDAGAEKVITSNTIVHLRNQIDISEIIADCLVI